MSDLFTPPPSPDQAPPLSQERMGGVCPKRDSPDYSSPVKGYF
jgi:hypothetical protein